MRPVAIGLVVLVAACDTSPPDYADMRRFRLSNLSDDQLRQLRIDAEAEHRLIVDGSARDKASREAAAAERDRLCADMVYRTRNDCSPGWRVETDGMNPTIDQLYEWRIMGPCRFVNSWTEAVRNECIAPKR